MRESVEQRALRRPELLLNEVGPRFPVGVGDGHAARIVYQHAEEVLLRHGRSEDQERLEQAEQEHSHQTEAQAHQDETVAIGVAFPRHAPVSDQDAGRDDGDRDQPPRHRSGDREPEIALVEDERRILKEEAK